MEPNNEKREKLKEFYYRIKNCCNCQLCSTRINFVFGSGNANASILFIGEAPGRNEDLQGKPFVGQAGKLLDGLLDGIGLTRNEVFIANVLKCRPPSNRDPDLTEINTCKQYLFEQIEIIDPDIICTLGKYSTQLILNTNEGITKLRGSIFKINGRLVLPINHPAAALYAPSRISVLKEDFNRIKSVLDKVIDAEKVFKIGNVSEEGAVKKSILEDTGESGPLYTKQRGSGIICPGGNKGQDEKMELADRKSSDEMRRLDGGQESDVPAGLMDSEARDESGTGAKIQADKNQQLGLF